VCIVGPRQSGKSTLAQHIRETGFDAEKYTLDDFDTRAAAESDPTGFVARIGPRAIIDEVQRVPDLLLAVKMRLDIDNARGQFLLTVSANIQTLPTIRDALPGRVEYVRLWTLAQCEIERTRPTLLESLFDGTFPSIAGAPVGRHEYAERVATGGYPDALGRTTRSRHAFFASYLDAVIGRDAPELRSTRSAADLEQVLRMLATRSSGLLNFSALATRLGINANTAKAYIELLEDLLLIRRHRAWHPNLGKREATTPKAYVTDSGLLAHLLRADEQRISHDDHIAGVAFETFAVMEILRQIDWLDDIVDMYHYRDKDKREVDVVLERADGTVVVIEIKSTASTRPNDLRGLRYLRDKLGDRFVAGIVLNAGQRTLPFGDRIAVVPLCALWQ
jgi:predicted AAA+ superfamily ATPase